jgi:hypothetical protein
MRESFVLSTRLSKANKITYPDDPTVRGPLRQVLRVSSRESLMVTAALTCRRTGLRADRLNKGEVSQLKELAVARPCVCGRKLYEQPSSICVDLAQHDATIERVNEQILCVNSWLNKALLDNYYRELFVTRGGKSWTAEENGKHFRLLYILKRTKSDHTPPFSCSTHAYISGGSCLQL